MDSLDDILQSKAAKLDIADKQSELDLIQKEVERLFPDGVRAIQVKDDTLVIKTNGSSLASEVRMRQMELLEAIKGNTEQVITKVWVRQ